MKTPLNAGLCSMMSLCLVACGADLPAPAPEESRALSAITAEQPGIVELAFRQYRRSASLARASYATPDTGNCNATMIGPNAMITAGHCGLIGTVTFRTYRDAGAAGADVADTWSYGCDYLVHTFADSDLNIHWCRAGADGVNPGDRHGYLDIDAVRPVVGQRVYSMFTNLQPSAQVPVALMYAPGKITRTDLGESELWSVPALAPSSGIESNVYGEAGSSGSSQLDAASNKIVVGPLSTASSGGATWRAAVSIFDYLRSGVADIAFPPPALAVNEPVVSSLGLAPQSYYGSIDKDHDNLFDIQTDLELLRGERSRTWYHLGFESARRNRLWTPISGSATFNGSRLTLSRSDGGSSTVITHKKLNLVSGGKYVVSGLVRRRSGSGSIWVGLLGQGFSGDWLAPGALAPFAVPADAGSGGINTELLFFLSGNGSYDIQDLLLTRVDGTVTMDLDDADQRRLWGDAGQFFGPGFMVPDGRSTTPGTPNWAVYVPTNPSGAYGARFDRVPVARNRTYQVCFDHMRDVATTATTGRANFRGAASDVNLTFPVAGTWSTTCVASWSIAAPATIQLGVEAGAAYRVDNLTITPLD